ncbi:hypothetical protein WJX73_004847 [Symbiochloris irregularis]|uniref:Smr domain-containing protein n=1 Tax=Symbiochloris irregularis TaxID=706552 RepID=A0AAW1PA58_9CHLO
MRSLYGVARLHQQAARLPEHILSKFLVSPLGARKLSADAASFKQGPGQEEERAAAGSSEHLEPDQTQLENSGNKLDKGKYLGVGQTVRFPCQCQGIGRRTTHRDIQRALAGFNLREEQIRVQLNGHFLPAAFWVDFPTRDLQIEAQQGSPYVLGPRQMWVTAETHMAWKHGTWHPFAHNSKGRFILMTGIQENATMADVSRHVAAYGLMANAITFLRETPEARLDAETPTFKRAKHRALIRMNSAEEAARAQARQSSLRKQAARHGRQKGWQALTQQMNQQGPHTMPIAGRPSAPVFDRQKDFPSLSGRPGTNVSCPDQSNSLSAGVWQPGTPERPSQRSLVGNSARPSHPHLAGTQVPQACRQDHVQTQLLAGHPWADSGLIKDILLEAVRSASAAFQANDHSGARRLALQAGQLRLAALAAHVEAADRIEHEHNAGRNLGMDILDLHGLHANEAVAAVDRRLSVIRRRSHTPGQHLKLQVIVGKGNHSSEGEGSLARVIETHLLGQKLPFKRHGGVLTVEQLGVVQLR